MDSLSSATNVRYSSSDIPDGLFLGQNYPNPFNPVTTIRFSLPQTGFASLKVLNLRGQEIATLVNEEMNAGMHKATWNATGFSSGVYFYRLQRNGEVRTQRMLLLK